MEIFESLITAQFSNFINYLKLNEISLKSNQKIKSSLYSPYYVEACNELRGQRSSEETSQRWRVVGDSVSI